MRANRFISVVACLIAVGCSDVDDASNDAKVHPGGAPRVVDAMNELAAGIPAERRFRYRLLSNCIVKTDRVLAEKTTERATFPAASTRPARFEYAPGLGFGLRVPMGPGGAEISIFDADRIDSIREMERLLVALASSCSAG